MIRPDQLIWRDVFLPFYHEERLRDPESLDSLCEGDQGIIRPLIVVLVQAIRRLDFHTCN
jgi:hypothetical protein